MNKSFAIIICLLWVVLPLKADDLRPFPTYLLQSNQQIDLENKYHQVLADTAGSFTIEDVTGKLQDRFTKNITKFIGIDKKITTWWFKIKLKNSSSTQRAYLYILSGGDAWADASYHYQSPLTGNWVHEKGGWLNPESQRETDDITDALLVELEAGEERTIYIRKKAGYILPNKDDSIGVVLADEEYHEIVRNDELFILILEAMFFGLVLMMTLYNFILFLSTKDKAYFWYVWVIFSFGLSFSEDTLYTIFSTGNYILYYYKLIDLLNAFAIIFNTLFVFYFSKQKNSGTWFWGIGLTTVIPLLKIVLVVFDGFSPALRDDFVSLLFIPNAILHLMLVFVYGIKGVLEDYKDAKILMFSGLALLFSLIVWNIHLLVVGEVLTDSLVGFLLYLSPKVSFVIMAALFSRHLTTRLKDLEQNLLQQQLISERDKKNFLAEQNNFLETQVRIRTSEIEQQKEEIETQRDALEFQNMRIMHQNDEIKASITAAKRIQTAMLPLVRDIAEVLPEHFILFRPRDIVSGDFYWFTHFPIATFPHQNHAISVITAVDCTGHGVPGAFMSMIGNELLNEIVNTKKIIEANLILDNLHKGVTRVLQQEETANRDGMDLSLCVIHHAEGFWVKNTYIEYAGANNPLYYVKSSTNYDFPNEFYEIKADKKPIGGTQYHEGDFHQHSIEVQPEVTTTFYLFSDGYQDQFGGEKGKKFMVKKLKELFTNIADKPIDTQKELLITTLEEWQGRNEQVDDILVIGFRV